MSYGPLFHVGGRVVDRVTDIVAIIGIATWINPSFLAWVRETSEFAGLLMPIFGVAWLGVQIGHRLWKGK